MHLGGFHSGTPTDDVKDWPTVSERTYVIGCLLACLTSKQHASVSQGRIRTDKLTCCHTETEVADQTFYITQSQYTDIRLTSPSADPIMPGAWHGSHWSANFEVTGTTRPGKIPSQTGFEPRIFHPQGGHPNHWASEVVWTYVNRQEEQKVLKGRKEQGRSIRKEKNMN